MMKSIIDDCCWNDDEDISNDDDKEYEKKIIASDGNDYDYFGASCSMSNDLVVIGAFEKYAYRVKQCIFFILTEQK